MSEELKIKEFLKFQRIKSRSANGLFVGDGVRGDGKCSLRGPFLAWSLLNREKLFMNPEWIPDEFQEYTVKPLTMEIIIQILLGVSNTLLLMMGPEEEKVVTITIDDHFEFTRGELEILIFQLSSDNIETIEGRAQFQILSLLLGVEIQILDTITGKIDCIGNKDNDTIRLSTGSNHYHLHNSKPGTDLSHFRNKYFWDLQWVDHPFLPKPPEPFKPFEPFI